MYLQLKYLLEIKVLEVVFNSVSSNKRNLKCSIMSRRWFKPWTFGEGNGCVTNSGPYLDNRRLYFKFKLWGILREHKRSNALAAFQLEDKKMLNHSNIQLASSRLKFLNFYARWRSVRRLGKLRRTWASRTRPSCRGCTSSSSRESALRVSL